MAVRVAGVETETIVLSTQQEAVRVQRAHFEAMEKIKERGMERVARGEGDPDFILRVRLRMEKDMTNGDDPFAFTPEGDLARTRVAAVIKRR
jgi:hypothetical protein